VHSVNAIQVVFLYVVAEDKIANAFPSDACRPAIEAIEAIEGSRSNTTRSTSEISCCGDGIV
jgi:hypothetical protein